MSDNKEDEKPKNVIKLFQDLVADAGLSDRYKRVWGLCKGMQDSAWEMMGMIHTEPGLALCAEIMETTLSALREFLDENTSELRLTDMNHALEALNRWAFASPDLILSYGELVHRWLGERFALDPEILAVFFKSFAEALESRTVNRAITVAGVVGVKRDSWWNLPDPKRKK